MKVGDYVRTRKGYICKIVNINEFREPTMKYGVEASYLKDIMFIGDEVVLKSSPNIIDLIEVGDYVNGYKVKGKTNDEVIVDYYCYSKELCDGNYLHWHKDYIETIVTKEQFKSMEYRIGG